MDSEGLPCSASTGPSNPEDDDGNHDSRGADNDLKEAVNKLIPASIGKDIETACQSIYPLHDVFVRKVKMLKKSKFEPGEHELHGEGSSSGKATGDETGAKVERADGLEPLVQKSV